jgi:hypothetical protein
MAEEAGIYQALWTPEAIGVTNAWQLIQPLQAGLTRLHEDPARFQAFNPPNGWGDYGGLVQFVEAYLQACQHYPTADVNVSR